MLGNTLCSRTLDLPTTSVRYYLPDIHAAGVHFQFSRLDHSRWAAAPGLLADLHLPRQAPSCAHATRRTARVVQTCMWCVALSRCHLMTLQHGAAVGMRDTSIGQGAPSTLGSDRWACPVLCPLGAALGPRGHKLFPGKQPHGRRRENRPRQDTLAGLAVPSHDQGVPRSAPTRLGRQGGRDTL